MKQLLIIVCLLGSFYCIPAAAQTKVYTGKTDDGDEIEMHLRESGNQLFGYYFLNHKPAPIPLHSRIAGPNVQLYDGDEVDGELYFDGAFDDSTIKGRWMQMKASKFTPYTLKLSRIDTLSKTKKKASGSYIAADKGKTKTLTQVYIDEKYFYFYVVMSSKTCTGYLHGVAKTQKGVKALFSDSKCTQLMFTTSGKTTVIAEKNCNGYHGPSCRFDGAYRYKK